MIDQMQRYREALTAFARRGNRYATVPSLTARGKVAGLTADEIVADAHDIGVTNRDADIRRMFDGSTADALPNRKTAEPPNRLTEPRQPTDRVRRMIDLGSDVCTTEELRELSPAEIYPGTNPTARRVQTETMLRLLFSHADFASVRRDKADRTPAAPGVNLRTARSWVFDTGGDIGEIVRPNPLTGRQGTTREGRPSYASTDCVAAFRHMVLEFDALPLADQCRFWAGVIRRGNLPLVSLVHSGGKSIHGIVRVSAGDADEYARYAQMMKDKYASDPDQTYRLDVQALNPLTGTRLAGAVRSETGTVQELIFDCGSWFRK